MDTAVFKTIHKLMQSVMEINAKHILQAAEFWPTLGLVQLGKAEKSSRSPEYLSREGSGAGNFTILIAFLPERK